MVVVFLSLFFLPSAVQAEMFCFYFEGDDMSERCTEDGKKVVDCPPNYIKNTDFYYPINFVGAYEPTVNGCILVPGYYVDFESISSLQVEDKYIEDLKKYWGSLGGQLMNNTVEGKLFKKTFIKNQLNLFKEGTCCVPKDVQEVSKDIFCGQPKIKYSDDEILNLKIENFLNNKLFADYLNVIDDGKSEFWDHVYCGISKNDLADRYEHWNISCTNPIPNEKDREKLKHIPASKYGHFNTNSSLIDSYLYCKHPLDSTKYCACLKTNNNKCFRDGSTWKTEEACNLFLEKNDNKKEYECIVCPPAKKPPAEKKVDKLDIPSTLGDLNKMGNVKFQVLIGKGIKLLMQVIGTIALLMFVYGGLLWMVSAGNTEKTKKAMDIMLWAGLGVIVILSSYAIVNFVFSLVK